MSKGNTIRFRRILLVLSRSVTIVFAINAAFLATLLVAKLTQNPRLERVVDLVLGPKGDDRLLLFAFFVVVLMIAIASGKISGEISDALKRQETRARS